MQNINTGRSKDKKLSKVCERFNLIDDWTSWLNESSEEKTVGQGTTHWDLWQRLLSVKSIPAAAGGGERGQDRASLIPPITPVNSIVIAETLFPGNASKNWCLPFSRRLMLLLEEKIQKMEQKNLGEMVFAAEVGLVGNGDGDTK